MLHKEEAGRGMAARWRLIKVLDLHLTHWKRKLQFSKVALFFGRARPQLPVCQLKFDKLRSGTSVMMCNFISQ